ncbi:carbohydrate sulfotransferase 11-like [Diadema setosum]|uniref:carbohydrate sulfotransferase 11-like n=1 Tax=Diadema setosum TaxID=31175 RepID=UPI003B3A827B
MIKDQEVRAFGQLEQRNEGSPASRAPVDLKAKVESIQAKRRRILAERCPKRNDNETQIFVSSFSLKHLLVLEKHKLIYCLVPKVGCSNWKRILMVLDGQRKSVDGLTSDEVHKRSRFKYLYSYSAADQNRILREYEKFLFVRHPFERLLSVYKNKLEDLAYYRHNRFFHQFGREIIKRWRPDASDVAVATGENATWPEFIKYVTDTKHRQKFEKSTAYLSDHWTEMNKICSPCDVHFDFIGHLETVPEESQYLLKKWGVEDRVAYLGAQTSRPTNSSHSRTYETYFKQLDDGALRTLWELFRDDFTLFDYPKPWFIPSGH